MSANAIPPPPLETPFDQRPTVQIPRVEDPRTLVPCPWCEECGAAPGLVTAAQRAEWRANHPELVPSSNPSSTTVDGES